MKMQLDITSIPVNEVFESIDEGSGCPICRLRDKLEIRMEEYITGAAMMEPSVRQETNKAGFCLTHFQGMLRKRNRLGVGLILESHLKELSNSAFKKKNMVKKSFFSRKELEENQDNCFICTQIEWAIVRMIETVCRVWQEEREFKDLYSRQKYICLTHYHRLVNTANIKMNRKNVASFEKVTRQLSEHYLDQLQHDITKFCSMFDYRNASDPNADWGSSKDAIERTIEWLTTRKP